MTEHIYVLWRQDAVIVDLPRRIDAARRAQPPDDQLAGRLLAALVRGDDRREHRAWALANHADLLTANRLAYD